MAEKFGKTIKKMSTKLSVRVSLFDWLRSVENHQKEAQKVARAVFRSRRSTETRTKLSK